MVIKKYTIANIIGFFRSVRGEDLTPNELVHLLFLVDCEYFAAHYSSLTGLEYIKTVAGITTPGIRTITRLANRLDITTYKDLPADYRRIVGNVVYEQFDVRYGAPWILTSVGAVINLNLAYYTHG